MKKQTNERTNKQTNKQTSHHTGNVVLAPQTQKASPTCREGTAGKRAMDRVSSIGALFSSRFASCCGRYAIFQIAAQPQSCAGE
jgi:hypothetical protein